MDLPNLARRHLREASPLKKDSYLATLLAIGSTFENLAAAPVAIAMAPLVALPIALRRRAPLGMAALSCVLFIGAETLAPPPQGEEAFLFAVATLLIAMYSVAAYERAIGLDHAVPNHGQQLGQLHDRELPAAHRGPNQLEAHLRQPHSARPGAHR